MGNEMKSRTTPPIDPLLPDAPKGRTRNSVMMMKVVLSRPADVNGTIGSAIKDSETNSNAPIARYTAAKLNICRVG